MAKITLTKAEANEIIRKHFDVASDFEIEIENTVNRYAWVDVPSDWNKTIAPNEAMTFDYIEVQTKDGNTERGKPTDFTLMWYQENNPMDIARYRGIESV